MSDRPESVFEYDGYIIPPYDPSLSPEERARLKEEADQSLEELIRKMKPHVLSLKGHKEAES